MRIIVDAFGGDKAPLEIIKGCSIAQNTYGYDIILVGCEKKIRQTAADNDISLENISIRNAEGIIGMNDTPTDIMKSKNDCSMAEGLRALANGDGDAFISAGNSGALAVGATFIVKRIKGIKRCAFAPVIPKSKGCFMLLDSGANSECRAEMLNQFGLMGSLYMEKVMGINNPRVGLVNVGTEDHKGDELRKETYKLLKQSGLNFIGNIEARDIPLDAADVVVTDGFTGNVILKLYEGMAAALFGKFKEVMTANFKTKLASAFILPELRSMKKQIDYKEYGGAPLMGVSKPVFKVHGNAEAKTVSGAIRLTGEYARGRVAESITETLGKLNQE